MLWVEDMRDMLLKRCQFMRVGRCTVVGQSMVVRAQAEGDRVVEGEVEVVSLLTVVPTQAGGDRAVYQSTVVRTQEGEDRVVANEVKMKAQFTVVGLHIMLRMQAKGERVKKRLMETTAVTLRAAMTAGLRSTGTSSKEKDFHDDHIHRVQIGVPCTEVQILGGREDLEAGLHLVILMVILSLAADVRQGGYSQEWPNRMGLRVVCPSRDLGANHCIQDLQIIASG